MKAILFTILMALAAQAHTVEEYHYREVIFDYVLPEDPLLDSLEEFSIPYWFDKEGKLHIVIPTLEYFER